MHTPYRPALTIDLPSDWSPEQALAVYDLLHTLLQSLWATYECPLCQHLCAELQDWPPRPDHNPQPVNRLQDDLPF